MDSEQDKPTSQQHASTPGAALAAAREAMGLTVEQVADQLKLAPRQVVAIEQGDYASLPNRAVTRGFIRAYAKAMRLDPVPLVAMVEVEGAAGHADATVRPTMVKASFQESRFPSLTERNNGKPMGAIVAGVAVLALIGVAVAWQTGLLAPLTLATRGDVAAPAAAPEPVAPAAVMQPSTQPSGQPGTQGAEAPLQSPNVPLISVPPQTGGGNAPATVAGAGVPGTAGGVAPAAVPGTNPPPAAVAGTVAAPVPGNAPAMVVAPANRAAPTVGGTQPTAPAPAAVPAAAPAQVAGQAPAVGAAGGKLVLTVKEDSWIEIRRPGQSALVARLVRAGSTETFNVREKDLLIVGKPSGVNANLAGGQLELPPVPGGTISRVPIK
jgi:cytoskeleton protein RodZ